jgi:putative ABC transport system ATP-binding protein
MIYINDLWKVYDTGSIQVTALRNITLTVEQGDFIAIVGASGSGKSTLMNIIGCLDKPTKGSYVLDNVATSGMSDDQLAFVRNKKIGFVFQSFNLLPRFNALHNVELPMIYGRKNYEERHKNAENALIRVGLGDRMTHKPNELSGGQKQRVAIARALVNNPAILLADEPTGNLDTSSTAEIMNIFKALNNEGVTIVIVTHEHEIAVQTKRIVTFRDGQIIDDQRYKAIETLNELPL